jgi:HK97 family phage major capsid protein
MTKLEILDMKNQLLEANEKLFNTASAEKRALSVEEKNTLNANLVQLEDLDLQERTLGYKGNDGKQVNPIAKSVEPKRFSLMKAINDRIEGRQLDDVAKDVFTIGKQEFRKAGITPRGDIVLPFEMRANILAGTQYQGQEIVAEDKKPILPPLTDKLIFSQAGATYLPGLVGDVSIPTYAGTTVAWKGEVEAAVDGGGAFSEVNLAPKRLTAYILVSKQFLAQDGVGAEQLLLNNIQNAVARKLEATILGYEPVSATQPEGIFYALASGNTQGIGAVPTWALMIGLETAVDSANAAQGNLAYITNSGGRGILKGIQKVADSGEFLCEDNQMNGYPVLVTNSCTNRADSGHTLNNHGLVFGNWADLVIASWGNAYDITVDPYTAAASGQVKIVINSFFDAKGMRGKTGSSATLNSYAYSFAPMAIKAS